MVIRSTSLSKLVEKSYKRKVPMASLMPNRVRNILLVSSLYDSFTFEEDGALSEVLFSEYLELNLRYAPQITRVSTAQGALQKLRTDTYDLVISMLRVGELDVAQFARQAKDISPDVPIILLAFNTRELPALQSRSTLAGIDRIFTWHGDVKLFLAIIKYVEDRLNLDHDVRVAGVQYIILVEDNINFYSSYLPLLYTELVVQTQDLMAEGLNRMERLLRMRARPKIMLATTWEEAFQYYQRHPECVLGVITDVSFPRDGKTDRDAGLEITKMVRDEIWDRSVLVQSSDDCYAAKAAAVGARFINKNSPTLLSDVRQFMRDHLGFGDFVFRLPDGTEVDRAGDLISLRKVLEKIPEESLMFHVTRNHFSRWLMARTEFDLARMLRPRHPDEFESPAAIRSFILEALDEHLEEQRSGVVAEFSRDTFHPVNMFVRIGNGSLGGKGRGLAFINSLLDSYNIKHHLRGVRIYVPPSTVLATDIFQKFMQNNDLTRLVFEETDEDKITAAFLDSDLPEEAVGPLREFLTLVEYPLAVRSSSLQEDASHQPFAGMYRTYMLPNNADDLDTRLAELCRAIKLVYASTYYPDPRSYFEATPNRLEEEQMAVLIQQIAGRQHDNYLYPDFAGVARSYDFYPVEGRSPEDGTVNVALGLGKIVVDGGKSIRFSPSHPKKLYQFSSVEDYLENSQREFFALDMSKSGLTREGDGNVIDNLELLGLDIAEKHGTLNLVGSTYVPENDAVYDGISRKGVRLVTMAGILKHKFFPLAATLKFLLQVGETAFSCPVELEFAVNMAKKDEVPNELAFLQIRPLVTGSDTTDLNLADIDESDLICRSSNALGQGIVPGIRDIIYVKPQDFDRQKTVDIANEIEIMTDKCRQEDADYLLIGPGRWGTADRFYGIPVNWAQISKVKAIIETDIQGVSVQPSQGTHFFHNITSFGIPYLTVNTGSTDGYLNTDWLDNCESEIETRYVKLMRFDKPVGIAVNGRKRIGLVTMPGIRPGTPVED